jgi:eukaryotic-like serine/threonine-protein kinase
MDPERWRHLERLYYAALERPGDERGKFLARACEGDAELRVELESLLAQGLETNSLLDSPAWAGAASLLDGKDVPRLETGTQLGPYRIDRRIGAGGMGEVYRARDTRLGRDVALKVLPAQVANDPARRDRFEFEAHAVAALNHPNIVAIFDVGNESGVSYMVTELVDGDSLRGAKFSLRQTLDIAMQICDGLAAAHAAGITHRDLKPENILLTRKGRIKILDFGLAKITNRGVNVTGTEPLAVRTEPGAVMGTAGYMSPEQVRGEAADHRSDLFSFGVILHELLSGKHPFRTRTTAETMAAILNQEAPELPESVPQAVRQIVAHSLEKDPASRFQSAKDLSFALTQADHQLGTAAAATKGFEWRKLQILLALLLIVLGILAGSLFWRRPVATAAWSGARMRDPEIALSPRISPDGHTVAFRAMAGELIQVAVAKPESLDWVVLTHKRDLGPVIELGWSADGTRIYYDRFNDFPQGIFSVPVLGGDEKLVLENAMWPEPLPDGSLLAVRQVAGWKYQLFRFWPETGKLQAFPIEMSNFLPAVRVFPDGSDAVVAGTLTEPGAASGQHLYVIELRSGRVRRLPTGLDDESTLGPLAVARDGKAVLVACPSGDLWRVVAVPTSGRPEPRFLFTLTSSVFAIDAGADGAVYVDQNDWPVELVRFAPAGGHVEKIITAQQYIPWNVALSDGRIVFEQTTGARSRLAILETGKSPVPLLNTSEETYGPITSAGVNEIACLIGRGARRAIIVAAISSGRIVRRIPFTKGEISSLASSPDGKVLYCSANGTIWSVLTSSGELHRIRAGNGVAVDPRGQFLLVQVIEMPKSRLIRVPLNGSPEQEIPLKGPFHLTPYPISSGAISADSRLLAPLASPDSWAFPPGVVDLASGRMRRIPVDRLADYRTMAWAPDGQVIAGAAALEATIWKFQPDAQANKQQ